MRGCKQRRTKRSTHLRRNGAILLDLFLATLIFSICVVAIGQFGSQSLQLARMTAIERIAALKAESIVAREIAVGPRKGPQVWKENLQGIPLTIRATWDETDQLRVQRVTLEVASDQDLHYGRTTVSLSRLVLVSEGK